MTPAARVASAIEILDDWLAGDTRAEALLRVWGRGHRFAGSKDRRAISDMVYDCIRQRRSLIWGSGAQGGRALALGLCRASGDDPADIFTGAGYGPASLTAEELARDDSAAPTAVALDHPDWLEPLLRDSLGDAYEATMRAAGRRAPVDLRVNRLKSTPEEARALLAEGGIEARPVRLDPDALRCPPGSRVASSAAYLGGAVELQDAASQAGARLAAARPGEVVLDYCAGGGGKALAIAAQMSGEGRVLAHDVEPGRMTGLPERAARAGAAVTLLSGEDLDPWLGRCDMAFVDAPCSGSGAWRRDPEAKWRLTPADLDRYVALQREAFTQARRYVRPGGRLVYATCSILDAENRTQVDWFAAEAPDLTPEATLKLPISAESDGFFTQVFRLAG